MCQHMNEMSAVDRGEVLTAMNFKISDSFGYDEALCSTGVQQLVWLHIPSREQSPDICKIPEIPRGSYETLLHNILIQFDIRLYIKLIKPTEI